MDAVHEAVPNAILMLDAPRIVTFKDGKHTYTYTIAPIPHQEWQLFFDGILYTSHNDGKGGEINTFDWDTPGLELVARTLINVEGYAGDFMSKNGWQQKLLPRHVAFVARTLRGVVASALESEKPFNPDEIEIMVDATWGNTEFRGLLHRFSPVTVELKRKFFRAGAQSRVVGGSRNGTTIHALRHKSLLGIYDELIQSVDGYGIAGRPISGREEIISTMDSFHKVRAAEQLFTGSIETESDNVPCPKCATTLEPGSKFCNECGSKIEQ